MVDIPNVGKAMDDPVYLSFILVNADALVIGPMPRLEAMGVIENWYKMRENQRYELYPGWFRRLFVRQLNAKFLRWGTIAGGCLLKGRDKVSYDHWAVGWEHVAGLVIRELPGEDG